MRTLTHPHTGPARAELAISVPHGLIELHAEDRADITITLTPLHPGDQLAADQIEQTSAGLVGSVYTVTVPEPPATIITGGAHVNGVTVVQNFGVVTGAVTGITIINGRVITGGETTTGAGGAGSIGSGGAVRATVRVPAGALVSPATLSADTRVSGPLGSVHHRSSSGDLRSTGTVGYLSSRTMSGDVVAPVVDHATVTTMSGDVRLTLTGSGAQVRTMSGDITLHATTNATMTANSMSGDITVTSAPNAHVRTTARSMSGRVRTGA